MIIPYLRDMINDHKTVESGEWKIRLNMHVNFISFKDTGETHTINILSVNEEIMLGNKTDDIITNLFESFLDNYQREEQIMRGGSDLIFEGVELLDYRLHKISLKRGKLYINSPEWIINKGATIDSQNYFDNNCFQYATTVALNHQNIEDHPERISNIEPFIDKYNWKNIGFSAHQNDQEDSEK